MHPFGPLVSDVWSDIFRVKHNKYKDDHPCQLPVQFLERILLMSTDEGDIVLDPFMGTGTTAIAAKKLNRRYIGFEKSKDYVTSAIGKLEQEKHISKIGNSYVSIYRNEVITIRHEDWENLKEYFEIPKNVKEIETSKIRLKVK